MKSIFTVYCLLSCLTITLSHLQPEDLLTDDAEQIYREKRNSFFENIFKTFPFFKKLSPSSKEEAILTDENSDNDVLVEPVENNIEIIPLVVPDESTFFPVDSVPTMHVFLPESTPFMNIEKTPVLHRTITPVVHTQSSLSSNTSSSVSRTASPTQRLTISPTRSTSNTKTFSLSPSGSTTKTTKLRKSGKLNGGVFHTSLPYATSITRNFTLHSTPSLSTYTEATSVTEKVNSDEPIFQMLFMNEPRLPDERQYSEDVFGKHKIRLF